MVTWLAESVLALPSVSDHQIKKHHDWKYDVYWIILYPHRVEKQSFKSFKIIENIFLNHITKFTLPHSLSGTSSRFLYIFIFEIIILSHFSLSFHLTKISHITLFTLKFIASFLVIAIEYIYNYHQVLTMKMGNNTKYLKYKVINTGIFTWEL